LVEAEELVAVDDGGPVGLRSEPDRARVVDGEVAQEEGEKDNTDENRDQVEQSLRDENEEVRWTSPRRLSPPAGAEARDPKRCHTRGTSAAYKYVMFRAYARGTKT
jgi:hypothetical protein